MSLSCDCYMDATTADHEWIWHAPNDYWTLKAKRGRRCCSCNTLIKPGETVAGFDRYRAPRSEVEARIYGEDEDVQIATWFHCEACADLYFSLAELGFCMELGDDMRSLAAEYASTYGPKGQTAADRNLGK